MDPPSTEGGKAKTVKAQSSFDPFFLSYVRGLRDLRGSEHLFPFAIERTAWPAVVAKFAQENKI